MSDDAVDELAIIDVAGLRDPHGAAARSAAQAIDAACRTTGFFLVEGHGVDMELLGALDAAARAFFAGSAEAKAEIAMARAGHAWRGWFPEGGELTAGRPDRKEGLYFGTELDVDDPRVRAKLALHGPNLFPASPPDLRSLVLEWMAALTELGHLVASGIAMGLGLPADWFRRDLTADPTVLFRIFRYPPAGRGVEGWGVAEHTDYGLLTLLAHDGTPGLEVRHPRAGWIDVPWVPGAFVVNVGDMLDRMTAGRYRSTPHRVRLVAGSRDRLSFPFFFDPGWDARVCQIPLSDAAPHDDAATRWDGASVHAWEGTYGDYLTAKVARVFPRLELDRPYGARAYAG